MASSARIDELVKKFDENPRRYFAPLANEYRKSGDLEQALALCRAHLPQQPGHMSGHIVYGQALYEARELDESYDVFRAALALDPENLIALRHLGDIERERGDLDAARDWYVRVLDADPRNADVQALIAEVDATPRAASSGWDSPVPMGTSAEAEASLGAPAASSAERDDADTVRADEPSHDLSVELGMAPVPFTELADEPVMDPRVVMPDIDVPDAAPARDASDGFLIGDASDRIESAGAFGAATAQDVAGSDEALEIDETLGHLETAPAEPELPTRDDAPHLLDDTLVWDVSTPAEPPPAPPVVADDSASSEGAEINAALSSLPLLADDTGEPTGDALVTDALSNDRGSRADAPLPDDLTLDDLDMSPQATDADVRSPSTEAVGDAAGTARSATPAGTPFVTETMATLYLQQGFRREALYVYRQLAARAPGDATYAARIAELEGAGDVAAPAPGAAEVRAESSAAPAAAASSHPTARAFFSALAGRTGGGMPASPPRGGGVGGEEREFPDLDASEETAAAPATAMDDVATGEAHASTAHAAPGSGALAVDDATPLQSSTAVSSGDDVAMPDDSASLSGAGFEFDDLDALSSPPAAGENEWTPAASSASPIGEAVGEAVGESAGSAANADPGGLPFMADSGEAPGSGSLDLLFAGSDVDAADDRAAANLAEAFDDDFTAVEPTARGAESGAAGRDVTADLESSETGASRDPAPTSAGRPSLSVESGRERASLPTPNTAARAVRPAADALSLDSVFRDSAPRSAAGRRSPSSAFSFDQFFDSPPAAPDPPSGTRPADDSASDVEQFNAWLEGLKKK